MKQSTVKMPEDRHPILRVTTRPNDANPSGDIFGGWLMSQIDIAGSIVASERAKGHVVTVAVKELQFINPLYVADLVSFFAEVVKVGNTSVTVDISVYAQRLSEGDYEVTKISDATLIYVAVSEPGKPRPVPN